MRVGIGEKIKKFREAKGISQDMFAKFLGVNCKDVIKWEEGSAYPDFELVPVMANYFEVTTDELMCMETFDNEDKIRMYLDRFQKFIAEGNVKAAVETMREGLLHFPDNFRFKGLLMNSLYLDCDRPAAIKHHSSEILSIYSDIMENCTDDAIRLEAKRVLCLHYFEDLRDSAKARETAYTLPGLSICREDMLPAVSEGEEKLAALSENIALYTDRAIDAISSFIENEPGIGTKEKIRYYEITTGLRKLIFPRGDYYGQAYAQMLGLERLASLYMSTGEHNKALDCLEEAAKCASDYDALPKPMPHVSPLVNRLKYNKAQNPAMIPEPFHSLKDVFMKDIICRPYYEPLKYNPRIKEICDIFID